MQTKQLIEIRCPFKKKNKHTGAMYTCNQLCVKVREGSAGETWCPRCKLDFEFEIQQQAVVNTSVRVKSVK